jgi:hypothetical protein
LNTKQSFILGVLVGILIGLLLATSIAHADTPTLHRHPEPPTPTLACSDELQQIRAGLVDVSIKESILWNALDTQAADFYIKRAAESRRTKALNMNYHNCLLRNLQELNLILASWQYQYAHDVEIISKDQK